MTAIVDATTTVEATATGEATTTVVAGAPQPPQHRRWHGRALDRARVRAALGVGLLVAVIVTVHLANIAGYPYLAEDEGTYYSQSWALQHLASLSPYTYWYDHPPLGWVQLASWTWLTDLVLPADAPSRVVSGRLVMVGVTAVTAALLYVLGRRLGLRRWAAGLGVVVWGLSPLTLDEARHVYLDNVALPWLVAAFVLAAGRRRDLWHYTAAGLCLGVAVLTKETFLLAAPALLVTIWHYAYRPIRAFGIVGAGMALVLCGAAYVLFAMLRNELLPGPDHVSLWDAVAFQLAGRESSGAVWEAGSVAGGLVESWLTLDAVLLVAGVVAALACLGVPRVRGVGVLVATIGVAGLLRPGGYLPAMYVVVLLPFLALAIAAVFDRGFSAGERLDRAAPPRLRWRWRTAVVALLGCTVVLTALDWAPQLRHALTTDTTGVRTAALDHVRDHVARDAVVVTDNSYWNDLVDAGWDPEEGGVVWFSKVDADPAFDTQHPRGWRDMDYLIWTPVIVGDPAAETGDLAEAYRNSFVVRAWGTGEDRVELRRVFTDLTL